MDIIPVTAVSALFGTLFGFLVTNFFKSPKEAQGDSERRLASLEALHSALALRFEGSHSRHDQALENLTVVVEKLTTKIDRLLERRHGGGL